MRSSSERKPFFIFPDQNVQPLASCIGDGWLFHGYHRAGRLQDQPVSAAMLIFSNAIAGIYWVGTEAGGRGRGLAGACVRAVTNEAFRRGAPLVILQARKFGEPLYRRMGFKEFTRYPWYMYFENISNQWE